MQWIYPYFLWALLVLVIPIIIHFFNIRRYKKIYFSNVAFIKQITQESQVKNKIKEYLVLALRLLALCFLVLAFAQPVMKKNKNHLLTSKNNPVVIYLDNSFSMENLGKEGKLLDIALAKAREIVLSFPKSTKFVLITNDNTSNYSTLNQNEILEQLSKINKTRASIPLSVILNKVLTLHLSNPLLFVISDAQKKFTDIQQISDYSFPVYYFLLSPLQKNNVSIDSLWITNPVVLPQQTQQLFIKLTNHNSENISDLPIKLLINDVQTALINVSIPAQQSTETSVSFLPQNKPFQLGKVFINDYPMTFDDEMYFALNSNIQIKVTLINGAKNPESAKYIRAVFQNDSLFIFSEQQEKQINYSELYRQDVVILNELTEYASGLEEQLKILSQQGKAILVFPYVENNLFVLPSDLQVAQWIKDTTPQTINSSVLKHPLFAAAFEKTNQEYKMPSVKEYLFSPLVNQFEPLIELNNQKPLLFHFHPKDKSYFVFTSPLNPTKNQLALHALFVPLMYQLAFTSIPRVPIYYYIGKSENIPIPNTQLSNKQIPKLVSAQNSSESFQIIPSFKNDGHTSFISIPSHLDILPNHYFLQWNNQNQLALSFNFDRSESDMQFYTEQELSDLFKQYKLSHFSVNNVSTIPAFKIIQSEISGTSYWKLFVILALLSFVFESVLLHPNSLKFLNKTNTPHHSSSIK